ncbi:hypothetical protein PPTG_22321 [Phytophthora nicotianae INRA-310]|uniref:Reverse transcriptase Ty1/copia-type domain-containing protein n=1 Tax=Phytophthora nicotianae (strain INRA-310) TaxID=761204 RepID=W2QL33_PHYN3|nr:hypothetical protein PPTG_22321 [Phytophthora nicotianae INRA-310]ETN13244.1 hypothetical protein PPTG_22321 [Phytophthora nicotianae INRA-310]
MDDGARAVLQGTERKGVSARSITAPGLSGVPARRPGESLCEGEVHHLCSNDLFDPENLAVHPQCVFSWKAQTEAKSKNDGPEAFEIVGSVSDESRRQLTFEDAGRRFLSSLHQEADEVLDRWLSHNVLWVQVAVQQADDKGLTAEMMTVLLLVRRNGTVRWSLQGLFKCVDIRALLYMTNLPELLWGEAAQHVVYTLNVTATQVLQGVTPHEKFSGEPPDVSCLRTWGRLTYYHIASGARSKKKKLSSRVGTSILIGYSAATHGYKVLDLSSGAV